MKRNGLLLVISGPSGVGKGSVLDKLVRENANVGVSISCTTRLPRENEVDGVHYSFLKDAEKFKEMIRRGEFLEYAKVHDNYYGTPLSAVEKKLSEGRDVVLEIDVQGAQEVRKKAENAVLIFIMPPSMDELKRRLETRNTESTEQVEKRLERAYNEIKLKDRYDYIVVNDDLPKAVDRIRGIIDQERKARFKEN